MDRRTDGDVWRTRLRRLWLGTSDDSVCVRPTVVGSLVSLAVSWFAAAIVVGLCALDGFAPEDWSSALVAVVVGLGLAYRQSHASDVRGLGDLPQAPGHADVVGAPWRWGLGFVVVGLAAVAVARAVWPSELLVAPSLLIMLSGSTLIDSVVALRILYWERRNPDQQVVSVLGDPGWLAVRARPRASSNDAEAAFGRRKRGPLRSRRVDVVGSAHLDGTRRAERRRGALGR